MKETEIPVQIGFEDEAFKQLNEDVEQLKRDKRDLKKRLDSQGVTLNEMSTHIEPKTPYRDIRLGVYLDEPLDEEDNTAIQDIELYLSEIFSSFQAHIGNTRRIHLPAGVWHHSKALELPKGVTLVGHGTTLTLNNVVSIPEGSLLEGVNLNFNVSLEQSVAVNGGTLSNCKVEAFAGDGRRGEVGVYVGNKSTILNTTIKGFKLGLDLVGEEVNTDARIYDCHQGLRDLVIQGEGVDTSVVRCPYSYYTSGRADRLMGVYKGHTRTSGHLKKAPSDFGPYIKVGEVMP